MARLVCPPLTVAERQGSKMNRQVGVLALATFIPGTLAAQSIEEVVVTAQKREQSLQEVPIAITGIDGDELIGNGADNLSDLSGIAPNVTIGDPESR